MRGSRTLHPERDVPECMLPAWVMRDALVSASSHALARQKKLGIGWVPRQACLATERADIASFSSFLTTCTAAVVFVGPEINPVRPACMDSARQWLSLHADVPAHAINDRCVAGMAERMRRWCDFDGAAWGSWERPEIEPPKPSAKGGGASAVAAADARDQFVSVEDVPIMLERIMERVPGNKTTEWGGVSRLVVTSCVDGLLVSRWRSSSVPMSSGPQLNEWACEACGAVCVVPWSKPPEGHAAGPQAPWFPVTSTADGIPSAPSLPRCAERGCGGTMAPNAARFAERRVEDPSLVQFFHAASALFRRNADETKAAEAANDLLLASAANNPGRRRTSAASGAPAVKAVKSVKPIKSNIAVLHLGHRNDQWIEFTNQLIEEAVLTRGGEIRVLEVSSSPFSAGSPDSFGSEPPHHHAKTTWATCQCGAGNALRSILEAIDERDTKAAAGRTKPKKGRPAAAADGGPHRSASVPSSPISAGPPMRRPTSMTDLAASSHQKKSAAAEAQSF